MDVVAGVNRSYDLCWVLVSVQCNWVARVGWREVESFQRAAETLDRPVCWIRFGGDRPVVRGAIVRLTGCRGAVASTGGRNNWSPRPVGCGSVWATQRMI
jgi:ribosomal protein L35AE/L33A